MKDFSVYVHQTPHHHILSESGKDSYYLLKSEINSYINKVRKYIPPSVQNAIRLINEFDLDKKTLDKIRKLSKVELKSAANTLNLPYNKIKELWGYFKEMGNGYKVLPQYISRVNATELAKGALTMQEIDVDLSSTSGRNAAGKVYMPYVMSIINGFKGKSGICQYSDLLSAASEAMVTAMNNWQEWVENPEGKHKSFKIVDGKRKSTNKSNYDTTMETTFKKYLGGCVKYALMNEINKKGSIISGRNDKNNKTGYVTTLSIDNAEIDQDYIASLGIDDGSSKGTHDDFVSDGADLVIKSLKKIENNTRNVEMFCHSFGVCGYKELKYTEIASKYKVSPERVRRVVGNIMDKLKNDPMLHDAFVALMNSYNESIMCRVLGMDREHIIEFLSNNDKYIMFEDIDKWKDKYRFQNIVEYAIKQSSNPDYIINILNATFNDIDFNFNRHKRIITEFVKNIYPTESISRMSDVELLLHVKEVQDWVKNHQISL